MMRGWASLPVALALSGCIAAADIAPAPLLAPLPAMRWWQGLNDPQLSALLERGARVSPATAIALAYIDLRARQTALVLMAERESLDAQTAALARQTCASGIAPCQAETAQAQLAATRAGQARVRTEIAALHRRLAKLTGSPAGSLDGLPGGPIPLAPVLPPPRQPRQAGQQRYDAMRDAAAAAQSQATYWRTIATLQAMAARAGTIAPGDAIAAERRALEALQAEEQARAALTRAYIALAPGETLAR